MSSQQHKNALLCGITPIFPDLITDLNYIFSLNEVNGVFLKELGQKIDGFLEMTRPTTNDGYGWFWALIFKFGTTTIIIAFPWTQDWKKKDEISLDRSIAIYTNNINDVDQVNKLLTNLVIKFKENQN